MFSIPKLLSLKKKIIPVSFYADFCILGIIFKSYVSLGQIGRVWLGMTRICFVSIAYYQVGIMEMRLFFLNKTVNASITLHCHIKY